MAQDQLEAKAESEVTPPQEEPREEDQAEKTPNTLFRFATWLHVPESCSDCEDAETGDCADPHHFHGWCRLPNQFQHREIREKALAAKARRIRLLKDVEADAYVILEGELDAVAAAGEEGKKALVETFVGQTWLEDFNEAEAEMIEIERDGEKPYEHIVRDRQQYQELRDKDPEERPKDEFEELERHFDRYTEEFEPRFQGKLKARREEFMKQDLNALIDRSRDERIAADSLEAFNHVYATWEWYVGTQRVPGADGPRYWRSIEHMESSAPEVVASVKDTFNELERERNDAAKNS